MSDDQPEDDPSIPAQALTAGPDSTIQLVARARTGDRDAVDKLLGRHAEPLRRWASGRLPRWARDLADTDDLVQDALLQTFRNLDNFDARGAGALQAYLRQAIANRVRDELRKRARRPHAAALDGREIDNGPSPLQEAIGREALERYDRALAALEPDEREAIVGRMEMGYSYEELAEILDKPTADAARKAARRALERLVELMRVARA